MVALYIVLGVLAFLGILFVLSTMGRRKHPGMQQLRGWKYAHRGLHNETRPENSMAAFRAALEAGYGIELDVHLLKDGTLAVIHDSLLVRTTGLPGRVEDLTLEELSQCFLGGTRETIPTFREVLELFDGKAPMIVELKVTDGNHAALAAATCDMLEQYRGAYCIESFDPRCVYWLAKNRPQVIRGQLTQNYLTEKAPFPWILRFMATAQMFNFLTRPDFIACRFCDRKNPTNFLVRKLWGVQGVTWTLRTKEDFDTAVDDGWLPIFENFIP